VPAATVSLQDWQTFYVIIGSAAAGLTGLQFVVVALSAERRKLTQAGATAALHSFATPTIVHFSAAILISALAVTPGQTLRSLGMCLLALGAAGTAYVSWTTWRATQQTTYDPVLEDWIFHSILPLLTYFTLLIAAFLLIRAKGGALYLVEADELLLLFIGIHNAWDSAVWIASSDLEPAPPAAPPSEGPE
jgi:hypothetical protein